ncbi:hypothetical protein EJ04DRAFT_304325 [Polyplosphaeria fusca]|uniref:Zn(2)-C6 fungal-type domain-containing protein n=1 Tax=Polyplosphaeria fusca TaxID=682080 RepID=A0A9P4UY31_9PLEO|nr:hypothetical protein EJ04DRAFT_304325 [Polyplosphaeria fusca]
MRRLKPCSRCTSRHARCDPDLDDPLGPCLTCIRSEQICPRFGRLDKSSVAGVRQLALHQDDFYRIFVDDASFDHPRYDAMKLEAIKRAMSKRNSFATSENAIVSLIVDVYGSSDSVVWDAFRTAFKIGFNPLWSHETIALQHALRTWALLLFDTKGNPPELAHELRAQEEITVSVLVDELERLVKKRNPRTRFALYLTLFILWEINNFYVLNPPPEEATETAFAVLQKTFLAFRTLANPPQMREGAGLAVVNAWRNPRGTWNLETIFESDIDTATYAGSRDAEFNLKLSCFFARDWWAYEVYCSNERALKDIRERLSQHQKDVRLKRLVKRLMNEQKFLRMYESSLLKKSGQQVITVVPPSRIEELDVGMS